MKDTYIEVIHNQIDFEGLRFLRFIFCGEYRGSQNNVTIYTCILLLLFICPVRIDRYMISPLHYMNITLSSETL